MAHILVVDNDVRNTERLATAWRASHHVQACATETDALSALGPRRIDLVITEYRLPDGSGLDLLQRIKATSRALPVIMLTAFGSEWTCARALKLGVRDYFVKPCNPSTLERSIRLILRVSASRRAFRENALTDPGELSDRGGTPPSAVPANGVEELVQFIHQHYWESISFSEAARHAGVSKFAFSRRFKALMRVSFRAYLQDVRVRNARELLLVPGYSITEIAQMLGFGDLPRFDKVFKRFEGISPSAYRSLTAPANRHPNAPDRIPADSHLDTVGPREDWHQSDTHG
jgi:two-component system response regulator YesN